MQLDAVPLRNRACGLLPDTPATRRYRFRHSFLLNGSSNRAAPPSSEQPPRRASEETMATKSIVIDLEKCIDKEVRVTFQGGREVRGVLKGFDQLVNIVLDDCVEEMHDPDDPYKKTDERRRLGLVVCRGLQVSLVAPVDGMEEIANPFIQQEEEVV